MLVNPFQYGELTQAQIMFPAIADRHFKDPEPILGLYWLLLPQPIVCSQHVRWSLLLLAPSMRPA